MPPESEAEEEVSEKHVQSAVRWADIETGEPPKQHGEFILFVYTVKVSCVLYWLVVDHLWLTYEVLFIQ